MHVQVPTNIVRNEDIFINNETFLLYVRLCFLYFKNYQNEEIRVDHKKLMGNLRIGDTRTFKNRMNMLHENNLIRNKIDTLPRKGNMTIVFNGELVKDCKHFTMLDVSVFDYMDNISPHAYRLLFYYKSHINTKDGKRLNYCFVGMETLKDKLKMGNSTIIEANEKLVKCKLIKITKHKLENTYEYNKNDELIFDRYNNHYHINEKLF